MASYDPKQSFAELLTAIQTEADECGGNTALPLVPFAALLVKLSKQAEKQTASIIRLTWALIILTILLLGFTAYLSYDAYEKNQNSYAPGLNDSKPKQAKP